jgi:hypothetical protein
MNAIGVLLQENVQTGVIDGAGYTVTIAGIVLVVAWWAYLYR